MENVIEYQAQRILALEQRIKELDRELSDAKEILSEILTDLKNN
jgi:transposase